MNIQYWFTLELTGLISLQPKWLSKVLQHHSSKASILWRSAFLIVQLSHPYMTTGKTIALTRWTFVSKVKSLFFNRLSGLVIASLPRTKHLLISWLQAPCAVILEPKKWSLSLFPLFIYLPWSDRTGCHDLLFFCECWALSQLFSLSSFTLINELFSSSSLSAISVVSSVYLRLLIFLPAILIIACTSSSPDFCMIYSAYKLNKQGDSIQS